MKWITYKIVHREFGSYSYILDTLEDAIELCNHIVKTFPEYKKQVYVREVSWGK